MAGILRAHLQAQLTVPLAAEPPPAQARGPRCGAASP